MAKAVCVLLDDEQEILLKNLLRARRDKCASRIIREALWCYAEKILPENSPSGANKKQEREEQ